MQYREHFTATNSFTVKHNLADPHPIVAVYDRKGVQSELSVTCVDENTVCLNFNATLIDYVVVVHGSSKEQADTAAE